MITKWKTILTNWINCNLNEPTAVPQTVNQESLLNLVSHLHNNCLDESKSSVLEAHTLEEFILEKYPEFQFENGTVEATTDEELYIVASLLLFFVCVSSKDADLKNAMCSKLSPGDQETILKYSKSLLECAAVTHKDVQTAILEACGREIASADMAAPRTTVSETPPALRSLHGEVRRLHAALDAERFDRNYLQEELARTQIKLGALAKEKEEQKYIIQALKTKVSECCGQETEDHTDGATGDAAPRLLRQIDTLEQRLADTIQQLDDLAYERDAYKAKAEDLKRERDKCFAFGQQESSNASQLAEQLEVERRGVASLQELVAELRQHNRHNGLDASQLECDDGDASVHSFSQNLSVCNEACANVVEVQLGEERAKVADLTAQIQALQDQLTQLSQRTEEEKLSLHKIISDKDEDILNLKHRINEGIEATNHIKTHLGNEITKLTNDLNELEQKIRENSQHYSRTIEEKLREIQTLQEEKLSLLQSLSDETTKLDNVIKDQENTIQSLKADLNSEKNTKQKLKDDYEAQVMKLKEKILNRNNELVELQNNASTNSEMIESLHFELRKERENIQAVRTELEGQVKEQMTQCSFRLTSLEETLEVKIKEVQHLVSQLKQKDDHIEDLKKTNTDIEKQLKALKEMSAKLIEDIKTRDEKIKTCETEITTLNSTLVEQKETLIRQIADHQDSMGVLEAKLTQETNSRDATIHSYEKEIEALSSALTEQKEILTHEIIEKEAAINSLTEEIKSYKLEITNLDKSVTGQKVALSHQINEKDATIGLLQMQLQSEIAFRNNHQIEMEELQKARDSLLAEVEKLRVEFNKVYQEAQQKNQKIDDLDLYLKEEKNTRAKLKQEYEELNDILQNIQQQFADKCQEKDEIIDVMNSKLTAEVSEKEELLELVVSLKAERDVHAKDILELKESNRRLAEEIAEKNAVIENLEKDLSELTDKFNCETSKLKTRVNETERILKNLRAKSNQTIESASLEVQTLKNELANLERFRDVDRQTIESVQSEKDSLVSQLDELQSQHQKMEAVYIDQCTKANEISAQLRKELEVQKASLSAMEETNRRLLEDVKGYCEDVKSLQQQLERKTEDHDKLVAQNKAEIEKLTTHVSDLSTRNATLSEEFNKEIQSKSNAVEALQKESEKLLYTIDHDNSTHKAMLEEKDKVIDNLEHHLKDTTKQLTYLQTNHEENTLVWEKLKLEMKDSVLAKESQMSEVAKALSETKASLVKITDGFKQEKEALKDEVVFLKKDKEEVISKLRAEIESLQQAATMEADNVSEIIHQKEVLDDQLAEAKGAVENLQSEKQRLVKVLEEKEDLIDVLKKAKHDLEVTSNSVTQNYIAEKTARKALSEQLSTKLAEKEILTQQLIEEKSTKDLLQTEKDMLVEEKNTLVKNKDELKQRLDEFEKKYHESVLEKEVLLKEYDYLFQQISEEKDTKDKFEKSKNSLVNLNQTLITKVADERAINDILAQEKELLMAEKETLVMNLSEEKAAKDTMENEKEIQEVKLNIVTQEHAHALKTNLEEIKKVNEELNTVKNNLNEKSEFTARLTNTLNVGLGKLLKSLQNENTQNEVLKKLITVDNIHEVQPSQQCDLLLNIAETLTTELALRKNLEKALEHENSAMSDMREMLKQKEMQLHDMQMECRKLEQGLSDLKSESSKQREALTSNLKDKTTLIQSLEAENKTLNAEINDVKLQLELKVHSLKEKLADTEVVTDKLKRMYECQIENLNVMVDKLTNYLKDKTVELDAARREQERLVRVVDENKEAIKLLEQSIKTLKLNEEKLLTDFESERAVLKNMITVTESVMEDQKTGFEKLLAEHAKVIRNLEDDKASLTKLVENEKENAGVFLQEKDAAFQTLFKELTELRSEKEVLQKDFESQVESLKGDMVEKVSRSEAAEEMNKELAQTLDKQSKELANVNEKLNDIFTQKEVMQKALQDKETEYTNLLQNKEIEFSTKIKEQEDKLQEYENSLKEKELNLQETNEKIAEFENKLKICHEEIKQLTQIKDNMEKEKTELEHKFEQFKALYGASNEKDSEEITKLKEENTNLVKIVEENKSVITNLDQLIKHELEQNQQLREQAAIEKRDLTEKCIILEQHQEKAEKELNEKRREVSTMNAEIKTLKSIVENDKAEEKDTLIGKMTKDLLEEQNLRAKYEKELDMKSAELNVKSAELVRVKDEVLKLMSERESLLSLRKANEELFKSVSQRESLLAATQGKAASGSTFTNQLDDSHQVPTPSNDITHSSPEATKTIVDLETIIHDKYRTITVLQTDVTYLRSQVQDAETKIEHLTNELEISKESCTQLSNQLKKIVHQKNEEIAELKKQVSKMSVTENRATQIIKVSAKYQAIILKRIAEIRSNTVLKELTNFGNAANVDNELRKSIAGNVTMEDLENFLETTDRHLKRCSEKQLLLQKERDRLTEVNRINESEIINLKKFLTEMSVSFKTFMSVKDIYAQRLSRVVSLQRTVRREILNLDGQVTDAAMFRLERGYTAVLQDLAECAMNLERWVERSITRTISSEKIKQAFASELDRASMACGSFQNAGLEVQLDELENSFQKLLEEVSKTQRGDGAKDAQAVTVMEVRAEYEDKLNRMKSKMKQLYQEQIAIFRDKQKEEIAVLERELQKTRDKMAETSRDYEKHIRSLTAELWSVGEKFLMKKDEAEWLRRNKSGSLQSLQHLHSSGLAVGHDDSFRPSDAASLRSLPVRPKRTGKGGRGLHVSDEEGEVFDNQCLRELQSPARAPSPPAGARLSELRWRNSLCPPHLRSSYPAETQFAHAFREEEIKNIGKPQRKEVGITAYKKPGPPTPSKQAGRLSATDSELRESLRAEAEPIPRKTSTPSRLRALFRSSRTENADGTPRSRRLSIFRSKK